MISVIRNIPCIVLVTRFSHDRQAPQGTISDHVLVTGIETECVV